MSLDCCPAFIRYPGICLPPSSNEAQSVHLWLSKKYLPLQLYSIYAAMPAAHRVLVVFLPKQWASPCLPWHLQAHRRRHACYQPRRDESGHRRWDVPLQGTSLNKTMLSWSVDRRQWRRSASVWVYIENNTVLAGLTCIRKHTVNKGVFGYTMWFVEL